LVPDDVSILPPPDARRFELLTRTDAGLPPAVPTVSRQAVVQTITVATR
jgi:hypothetical protein